MEVTIIGYKERYIYNPKIKIYEQDTLLGEVKSNGIITINVSQPCLLTFKCNLGNTQCRVTENTIVILSTNRITGGMKATPTNRENTAYVIKENRDKDLINTILTIIIGIASLICIGLTILL